MTFATGPTKRANWLSICLSSAGSQPGGGVVVRPAVGVGGLVLLLGLVGSIFMGRGASVMMVSSESVALTGAAWASSSAQRKAFALSNRSRGFFAIARATMAS